MTWNSKTVWWFRVEKGKKEDTDVPKLSPLDVSDRGRLEEGQAGYWASCRSVGRGTLKSHQQALLLILAVTVLCTALMMVTCRYALGGNLQWTSLTPGHQEAHPGP